MEQTYEDYYIDRTLKELGLDFVVNSLGEFYAYAMGELLIFKIDYTNKYLITTRYFDDLSSEHKKEIEELAKHLKEANIIDRYEVGIKYWEDMN